MIQQKDSFLKDNHRCVTTLFVTHFFTFVFHIWSFVCNSFFYLSFTFEALFVTYFYICISHLKLCLCVLFGMAAMLWLYCVDNCHKPLVILIQNNQQHQHKHCDLKIVLKDWFINQPILSKRLNPLIYWGSRFTVHEGQNASDTQKWYFTKLMRNSNSVYLKVVS